jgi:hypothetical protein
MELAFKAQILAAVDRLQKYFPGDHLISLKLDFDP